MKYEKVRYLVVTTMTFNNLRHYYVLYARIRHRRIRSRVAIGLHGSIKQRMNSKMFFNRRRIVIVLSARRPVVLQPPA